MKATNIILKNQNYYFYKEVYKYFIKKNLFENMCKFDYFSNNKNNKNFHRETTQECPITYCIIKKRGAFLEYECYLIYYFKKKLNISKEISNDKIKNIKII